MSKKPIMVIDDNHDIRNSLASIFDLEGYPVIQAENGREALDILLSTSDSEYPCLIILDLMMPVMDGRSFLREIHENHPKLARLSIVLASANMELAEETSKEFKIDKLKKPLDLDDVCLLAERHSGES